METGTTFSAEVRRPALILPAGACDSHCHILGPGERFPFAPMRKYTPPDFPKEMLYAAHKLLGITRCVIVQSALHGVDNSAVEDAIEAGGGAYLGVAIVPVDVKTSELERLAKAGFRAVRFNFMRHLTHSAGIDEVIAMTPRLAQVGMHLQIHFESDLIHELAPKLKESAVRVVIDHMGRVDAGLGLDHADFRRLHALLEDDKFFVKVSGVDRSDRAWPYPAGVPLARSLVERFPDRCLWGTDWPHLHHHHVPDTAALVDLLPSIAPSADLLERLMVSNPQRLYEFPASL